MSNNIKHGQTDHASPKVVSAESRFWAFAVLAVCSTLFAAPATSADSNSLSNARAIYQKDRAMCNSGQSNQDRATCLQEAGAAYNAARGGQLNDDQAQYEQNAMARCAALPPEELKACQRRMMGGGVSEGNAQDGGIYRKIESDDVRAPNPSIPPPR